MNRNIKKWLGLALLVGWVSAALAAETNNLVPRHELKPGPDDAKIAAVAASVLSRAHYTRQPFDDSVSSKMLDLYLKMLDPQHIHFLQTDLEKFEPYRTRLDDLTMRRGDTWPAYEIFTTFLDRLEERTAYAEELLKTEKFDFSKDERVLANRKDQPAPKDLDEAKKLWRERLRFEYLQEKLARSGDKKKKETAQHSNGTNGAPSELKPKKTEAEEIAELLAKRYRRTLHIFQEMDSGDVFELYLNSLAHVYDPHTDYFGKSQLEQFAISMNLALFGIGAQLRMDDDGYCNVEHLMPGGPALKNGKIKEKDRIVAVAQSNAPAVDIVGMNMNKAVQLIRGPKGSEVRLTIETPDTSERKIVSLIRDEIPLEDQQAKARIVDMPGQDGKSTRVGVIDLPSFYASFDTLGAKGKSEPRFTSTDVALLIKKLKQENVHGIILDLRHNGGGSLEEAVKLTGLFIKEGPVVQVKGPEGDAIVDSDTDPSVLWDGPLVVLTSRFSASASEIVAAALQDYGRALIVGDSSTHGKGTVQSLSQLKPFMRSANLDTSTDPGALKFTIRKFYRASGASTQFEGVTPDIVLPSVFNYSKEIGEKSLDYPLPWDTIPSAKFDKVDRVAPFLVELRKDSEQRIAKDKDFEYIREDIAQFVKRQDDKTVSLNEKERMKEKAEEDARQKARNKERLARKTPEPKIYEISLKQAELPGLPPPMAKTNTLASATATSAHAAAALSSTDPLDLTDDGEEKPPAVDATMDETEHILVDYMRVLDKVVTAKK
jgi:carboxyl-terminal processing protease